MFIFHEGLPGSGKSYECVVHQIIPALKSGRKVFARINGLDHQKIATLLEVPVEKIRELLIPIPEDEISNFHNVVENDSLVVLDEMQNFWGNSKNAVSPELTVFITEHRHKGIDIVGMGQSIADINVIWRRRCQQKIQFLKLDMLGKRMATKYKWTMYQGMLNGRGEITFTKVNSGQKNYDDKYFGTYKSHQDATTNYDNKSDDRVNIFNNGIFKLGVPAFICLLVFAVWYLISLFSGGQSVVQVEELPKQSQQNDNTKKPVDTNQLPKPPKPKLPADDFASFVFENSNSYQGKVVYKDERGGVLFDALVVWTDEKGMLKDQVYLADLRDLGFKIQNKSYGFIASKADQRLMFRWIPDFDIYGAIPKNTQSQLASNTD